MAAEASGAVKHQGSGSNSPRAMSPAPATPPLIPPPGIACPSPPTVVAPTVAQPKLMVPPPPVAIATPHLYNPPPVPQGPPVAYPTVDYGVPPPPVNGYPTMPSVVPPVPPPPATQRGFGGFAAPGVPAPVAPPPSQFAAMPPPPPPAARPQPAAPKGERTFEEKMERILERTKAKQEAKLAMPVTFGATDPLWAPKDPSAEDDRSDDPLALTAKANQDVQSMALALIGDNTLALKGQKNAAQGDSAEPQKKKKRVVEAKKIQPK
ncbi:unnamed protein product, partial [Cylicostephanus goldi]